MVNLYILNTLADKNRGDRPHKHQQITLVHIYLYFRSSTTFPIFRSSTTSVSMPPLGRDALIVDRN